MLKLHNVQYLKQEYNISSEIITHPIKIILGDNCEPFYCDLFYSIFVVVH